MKTQGWGVKYGPNKLGVTLPYPISTIPCWLALSLWLCDDAIKRYFAPQPKKMWFWLFFLFWKYLLMASSKIGELNANRFAMVDLGGVWSNSIVPPRFLGWSLEKIKIDKFFEIFQFFVWAILFSHELTRTSSDFGENGAIWFANFWNRGGHVNLPPKLFFSKVKIPKY